MWRWLAPVGAVVLVCFGGCGASPDDPPADAATICSTSADCDDGSFCNGPEQCEPTAVEAGADGCVAGTAPCAAPLTCDESADTCAQACTTPDADGDGRAAVACGGDDCDDDDANRFPGNPETCDANDHDEDCDPTTFGYVDADNDQSPDAACCNVASDGTPTCGTDCDDQDPSRHPNAMEVCDDSPEAVDENCDGVANPDPPCTCNNGQTRRCPGFGLCALGSQDCIAGVWGACSVVPVDELCDGEDNNCNDAIDEGFMLGETCDGPDLDSCREGVIECNGSGGTRCGDTTGDTLETCDGSDEDCDGNTDEGGAFGAEGGAACGSDTGICQLGTETCMDGDLVCFGETVAEANEICDGMDHDCDGDAYNTFACGPPGSIVDGACIVNACGTDGVTTCEAGCGEGPCLAATETCNYCDDNGGQGVAGGWGDERGIASTIVDIFSCDQTTTAGAGDCGGEVLTVHLGRDDERGSVRLDSRRLGFGTATLSACLSAGVFGTDLPERGWALFLHRTGEGNGGVGTAANYGVPQNRNGYSLRWEFNGGDADNVRAHRLRVGAASVELGASSNVSPDLDQGPDTATQCMWVEITPDDPNTVNNEMEICMFHGASEPSRSQLDIVSGLGGPCCLGDECEQQLSVGDTVRAGISGANGASNAETTILLINNNMVQFRRELACPDP